MLPSLLSLADTRHLPPLARLGPGRPVRRRPVTHHRLLPPPTTTTYQTVSGRSVSVTFHTTMAPQCRAVASAPESGVQALLLSFHRPRGEPRPVRHRPLGSFAGLVPRWHRTRRAVQPLHRRGGQAPLTSGGKPPGSASSSSTSGTSPRLADGGHLRHPLASRALHVPRREVTRGRRTRAAGNRADRRTADDDGRLAEASAPQRRREAARQGDGRWGELAGFQAYVAAQAAIPNRLDPFGA